MLREYQFQAPNLIGLDPFSPSASPTSHDVASFFIPFELASFLDQKSMNCLAQTLMWVSEPGRRWQNRQLKKENDASDLGFFHDFSIFPWSPNSPTQL
jgi:hypothetical protein